MFLYFRFEFKFNDTDENGTDEEKYDVIRRSISGTYFNQIQIVALIV